VSAWLGGIVDSIIMRSLDALLAFPSLVLVLAMSHGLGPGTTSTTIALMLFSIPAFARVSRASTLRLRERPFMLAAQVCGTHPLRILIGHLAPNILPQLAAFALLGMGICIMLEGGLSFLGLGVQPPEPSWGNMISLGQQTLTVRPYLLIVPSAALFLTVLCLNLLGEKLRERWSAR
jgi:peptide/nickel transport system permease protein